MDPFSRRLLGLAAVLGVLVIALALFSLVHDGGESPFSPNPVAAAAERVQNAPGMRMTLTMRVRTGSAPATTMTGSGVYNGEDRLALFTYHATGPQGASMEVDALLGEDAWYFRYPQFASRMPAGKEWIKVQGLPGQSDASKMSESPDNSLQMLTGAGSVQRLGHADVRGVPTTRYRATLTAAGVIGALRSEGKDELADQFESTPLAGPIAAEVFIDSHGMLRRMSTVTTLVSEGQTVVSEVQSDLFDFGIRPAIQLPPPSVVLDPSEAGIDLSALS